MTVFRHIRLLPMLVIVSFLSLMVRVGEFASGLGSSGSAYAQHETAAEPPPLPQKEAASEDKKTDAAAAAEAGAEAHTDSTHKEAAGPSPLPPPVADPKSGEKVTWRDAGDEAVQYSEVREDLYKDLAARRQELDKREKDMATREALLKAGERELDQKLRELTAVRNEIQGLLKQQSDEEKTRVDSLVKIYEGMKAKDAARIFNTLDMNVLIQVMSKMSERKSAPILAEMNPDRARAVTILLAQQQQLPDQLPQ